MAICKRNTCYISVGRSKFYYCRKLREEKHENRKESLLSILIRESVDSCVSIISKKKATSSKKSISLVRTMVQDTKSFVETNIPSTRRSKLNSLSLSISYRENGARVKIEENVRIEY